MDITQFNITKSLLQDAMTKLSCCGCLQDTSLYEEIESFLSIQNNLIDKGAISLLDKLPPASVCERNVETKTDLKYDYFLSVGFPQKDKVFTKYVDKKYRMPNMINLGNTTPSKYILGKIEYRQLTTDEQYKFIICGLNQIKDLITPSGSNYHYFIEKCQSGDLHFHGRFESGMNMKDLKLIFHNAFGISLDRLKTFTNIKKYDALKWKSYHQKMEHKDYQTTNYPHIKSV